MALVKCIECGKKFSDQAIACPNCAAPTSPPELTFSQKIEKEAERLKKLDQDELERIAKLPEDERKFEELEYSLLYFCKYLQGVCMKFMDKIELVVKLKEKIAEAKATNEALALQLQSLLDQVLSNPQNSPAI